jgi:hypothetical protein
MIMKRLLLVVTMMFALLFMPQAAYAATPTPTPSPSASTVTGKCGDTKTQLIACNGKTGIGAISDLIKIAIVILTVLIGVVATGGIAYAAILYASARDSQSQLDQSKTIIRNVVIGLFLYGFTIAIINWLIPGGVIG